jgi:hypothetical protein
MGDRSMTELNRSMPGKTVEADEDDNAEYLDGQLQELNEQLRTRGLKAHLVAYMTDGTRGKHHDAITVTNPAVPERGSIRIEKEGWVTWEYSGSISDPGISKLADEAARLLWAADEIIIQPDQRELLVQALTDAEHYRDPPLHCPACETQDTLCDRCAADMARTRAYLALSRTVRVQESQ